MPLAVGVPEIWEVPMPWGFYFFKKGIHMTKTAILVDGGFYRRKAQALWGEKRSDERVKELMYWDSSGCR